jgi:hypothetical protein
MKKIDNRILEEIARYNSINNYIVEQDATLPPPPGEDPNALPPEGGAPAPVDPNVATPAPAAPVGPQPVDLENDPDVEKVGEGDSEGKTEEMDITDLVKSQKNVEQKQEEYFNNLFQHLDNLETKLGEMDGIMTKLNDLESKLAQMDQVMAKIDQLGATVEANKPKTEVEKLEMRSLDSYPFNEKPQEFFAHKQGEMRASGKNEYVLTKDDIENYPVDQIRSSFNQEDQKDEYSF